MFFKKGKYHCAFCGKKTDDHCSYCGKPICKKHRAGTLLKEMPSRYELLCPECRKEKPGKSLDDVRRKERIEKIQEERRAKMKEQNSK